MHETSPPKNFIRQIALVGIMAALSNALGFLALPGPLNIQFGLTAIPFLVVAFILGPRWGALCGLLGGVVQAEKYGHLLYVFYTAIQGLVAGYFARTPSLTRRCAPLFGLLGGAFLLFWVDLLRSSNFKLGQLGTTSFASAPSVFGTSVWFPMPPVASIIGAVIVATVAWIVVLVRPTFKRVSIANLTFAGCYGAIAYVLYDMWVLHWIQGYPWLPTWFVLSKDLVQDFVAAALCASVLQQKRLANILASSSFAKAG